MDLTQSPIRKWEVRLGEATVHFECSARDLSSFIPKAFPNGGVVHIFKEIDGTYVPFMEMEIALPPGVKAPDEDY